MNQLSTKAFLCCIEPSCLATHDITARIYTCTSCGGLLDVSYDLALPRSTSEMKALFRLRKTSAEEIDRSGVWRFRELVPFVPDESRIITLAEGNTPVYTAPQSARHAGVESLLFKHQGMNPTGSFKDNGMTTGVTQAALV